LTIFFFAIALEFYNPLTIQKNSKIIYQNNVIPELPKNIEINYNNLGYIGEDYSDTISRTKICFVGSSKTQSIYVPLEYQWTNNILTNKNKYWFNNCGKDGAGINNWVEEVAQLESVKPNYVVVLVDPFETYEPQGRIDQEYTLKRFKFVSSIINPLYKMVKNKIAQNKIGHFKVNWNLSELENNTKFNSKKLEKEKIKTGLNELINQVKKINAIPILISCPTPYGDYTNADNIEMKKIKGSLKKDQVHHDFSNYLDLYCQQSGTRFINGYALSKNTNYFYDHGHFNIQGSIAFSKFLQPELAEIIISSNSNQNHQGSN
jgi:hypothetical protein